MDEFNSESGRNSMGKEVWEIVKVLLISLAIMLPVRYFIVQPFIVRGASMEPNFEDRQYLFVDELSYQLREPRRGEVIVFRYPRDPSQFFIKRIIGLPGEKIVIQEGRVHIVNKEYPQGFILNEKYLDPQNRATWPDFSITLDQDKYFVLGDNRDSSSDSRVWGTLPKKLIMGRVLFRAWPLAKIGHIPDYSYTY